MRKRRPLRTLLQLFLGVALVALMTVGFKAGVKKMTRPHRVGWDIIGPSTEISALALQGDVIWAGGKKGLMCVNRTSAQTEPLPQGAPLMAYIKDLLVDRQGDLWIAHQDGVTRLQNGGRWEPLNMVRTKLAGPAFALLEDRSGILWIGGEKGLVRYDGRSFELFDLPEKVAQAKVDVLFQDNSGTYWFGSSSATHGMLLKYVSGHFQAYSTQNGLIHNSVNCVMQDSKGWLWFGLGFGSHGGVSFCENGQWRTYTKADGLAGDKVRSLYEDSQGRFWFGSEYDGVAVLSGTHWKILTPKDGLAGWEVKEIIEDQDGIFWLGTEKGLNRIDAGDGTI